MLIAVKADHSRNDVRKGDFKNKKTTRRWFHDTAYCFDYSAFSHGSRSGT